jgi:hypothetical protein
MRRFLGLPQDKSSTTFCRTPYLYLQTLFRLPKSRAQFPSRDPERDNRTYVSVRGTRPMLAVRMANQKCPLVGGGEVMRAFWVDEKTRTEERSQHESCWVVGPH